MIMRNPHIALGRPPERADVACRASQSMKEGYLLRDLAMEFRV